MNKYIDNLTVAEYKQIERFLEEIKPIEEMRMKETGNTKSYIELRFILIKIQKIIKKYEKGIDKK